MQPKKVRVSGKTMYLVKSLATNPDTPNCRSCHFYEQHLAAYTVKGASAGSCFHSGRASVCQDRNGSEDESRTVYVTPQRLKHHILELATRRLTGEIK